MDISFIILAWNSENHIEDCLAGIDRAMARTAMTHEVLVLDNGSRDTTPALLSRLAEKRPGELFPCFEPVNIGTTRSRNRLFAAARGDYLCVLDSDVELSEGVIETLVPLVAHDRRLGIVAPRIHYPSGAWQKSFDRFPTLAGKIERLFRLRSIERTESARLAGDPEPFYVDYAISAFWLMRRELVERVGLLDERIFYAPEDADFCLRVWKAGYRILYAPSVSIVHHTQEISRGPKIDRAKLSHIKGLLYYFLKHRYLLRRPEFAGRLTAWRQRTEVTP